MEVCVLDTYEVTLFNWTHHQIAITNSWLLTDCKLFIGLLVNRSVCVIDTYKVTLFKWTLSSMRDNNTKLLSDNWL
jgi:hypothetical protein